MHVAFYKGRKRLFNRVVSWWTRGPYSHCELVIGRVGGNNLSVCWSASFLDGGVRCKQIDLSDGNWDMVPVAMPIQVDAMAIDWWQQHLGQPYDLRGMFGIAFRPLIQRRDKWFCSEAVAASLGIPDAWRFCPNTLAAALRGI
jgi:hypothetical protein